MESQRLTHKASQQSPYERKSEDSAYQKRVQEIISAVKGREPGQMLALKKANPGHRPHDLSFKNDCHPVDIDQLPNILEINVENKTVRVEGLVTLGSLCRETLKHNLIPQVVPEYETFTVAGLINGLGIETSSHKYGLFPEALISMDIVLGDGSLVTANKDNNSDLFYAVPGSYGTLGIITSATLQLCDASPYIHSQYHYFTDIDRYVEAFGASLKHTDFVEGFVLSKESYVLITGNFADRVDTLSIYDAMKYGNVWYYQHAEKMAKVGGEDLIGTYQYMFRHQRSLFWLSGIIAGLPIFEKSRVLRAYLDRKVEEKVSKNGFKSNMDVFTRERSMVNQDYGVELPKLTKGIRYVQDNLGAYPIWNCATTIKDSPFLMIRDQGHFATSMLVDVGIYGEPTVKNYKNIDAMRALQTNEGKVALWGVSYLSKEELEASYDHDAYTTVRRKYHADSAFKDLFSKTKFIDPDKHKQGFIPHWRLLNLWLDIKVGIRSLAGK